MFTPSFKKIYNKMEGIKKLKNVKIDNKHQYLLFNISLSEAAAIYKEHFHDVINNLSNE